VGACCHAQTYALAQPGTFQNSSLISNASHVERNLTTSQRHQRASQRKGIYSRPLYTDENYAHHIIDHQSPFQIGKHKNTTTIIVANSAPPSKLCATTLCCKRLRLSSLTLSFLSKIISLETRRMKVFFLFVTGELSSSKRSHGSG